MKKKSSILKVLGWITFFCLFFTLCSPFYHSKYPLSKGEISKLEWYTVSKYCLFKSSVGTDTLYFYNYKYDRPSNWFGFDYEDRDFRDQFIMNDYTSYLWVIGWFIHRSYKYYYMLSIEKYSNFKPFNISCWYGRNDIEFKISPNSKYIELIPNHYRKVSLVDKWHGISDIQSNSSPSIKFEYINLDADWRIVEYKVEGEEETYRLDKIVLDDTPAKYKNIDFPVNKYKEL